jgi:hypothetical protein
VASDVGYHWSSPRNCRSITGQFFCLVKALHSLFFHFTKGGMKVAIPKGVISLLFGLFFFGFRKKMKKLNSKGRTHA